VARLVTILELHVDFLALRNHFMFQLPVQPTAELSHDNITVTEQVEVKVDMRDRLYRSKKSQQKTIIDLKSS
jgi:hypothetical protein